MTRKAHFNADDWSVIVDGPLLAGMRVIAAERGGTLRESLAMGRVYSAARERHGESEFLDDLVTTPPAIDPAQLHSRGAELTATTRERLRHAVQILERSGTQTDVNAYKTFVMTVAQAVAEAHREGGLFHLGRRAITDAENEALDEISTALGEPPPGAV